jgi:hypothetical protein
MKVKWSMSISLITIMIIITLLPSQTSTVAKPSSMGVKENPGENQITIDGDISDWIGIEPVYVDAVGDTQPWSTNATLLSIGSTAETPEQVTINDKVRDLKAVYIYNDTHAIYVRLDVNSLIENWSYPHMNASCYVVAFDTDLKAGSGKDDLGMACDTYTNSKANWERLLVLYSSTEAYIQEIQDTNWVTVDNTEGGLKLAQNITASAFELSIPLADFPESWKRQPLAITVISFKPGEYPTSGTQQWLHAFDPQAPGTPGETWGNPGSSAQGSDAADVMPGGVDGIDSSGHVKDFIPVFGAGEVPSAFPWTWIIIAVVVIVVVIVAVYLAKRKKVTAK